jgi:phage/plasmid-associated DNA primase
MNTVEDSIVDILSEINGKINSSQNNYTHYTYVDPERYWTVPELNITKFWSSYCEKVADNNETLYLAEKVSSIMPVVFNLKFKYYYDSECENPFEEETILYMIACAQEAIYSLYQLSSKLEELNCCYLEPDSSWYEEEGHTKYRILKLQLFFPFCRIGIDGYENLRAKFVRELHRCNILGRFNEQPTNGLEDIVEKDIYSHPFLMYGGVRDQQESCLHFIDVYGVMDINEYHELEKENRLEIDEVFDPNDHGDVRQGFLSKTFTQKHSLDYFYPLLFSSNFWRGAVMPKEVDEQKPIRHKKEEYKSEEMKLAAQLIPILNPRRFTDPLYNKEIGKALYNACNGKEEGLELWVKYFAKVNKMDENDEDHEKYREIDMMRTRYYEYNNAYVTIKTLAWYAKEDNPDKYDRWHRDWCYEAIDESLFGCHFDVAKVLYRYKWLEYICVSPDGPRWLYFHNHRLINNPKGITLKKCISTDLVDLYAKTRTELSRQYTAATGTKEKDDIDEKIKNINTLINELKRDQYKTSIMKSAIEHFYREDSNISHLLDTNLNLTGLPNGVFEVDDHYCHFRPGKPEDYITKVTGVPYRKDFHWEHPTVKRYMKWIECMHRDKELRHEYHKIQASLLIGGNNDKKFYVGTGVGGNAKSQDIKCLQAALGQYCFDYPIELLTTKNNNPNGTSSVLATNVGSKAALTSEAEDSDKIRKEIIKKVSGGDRYHARKLFDDGGSFESSFKMFLFCNNIPVVMNSDPAFHERFFIIPYLSRWTDDAPEDPEEQMKIGIFKKDKFFDRQIPILAPAKLWVMKEHYAIYRKEGIRETREVPILKEYTDKYWEETDVYYQYINDCITPVKNVRGEINDKYSLTITQLYLNFKKWFTQSYPGAQIPDRRFFIKEMTLKWGPPNAARWYGIAFTETEREVSCGGAGGAGGAGEMEGSEGGGIYANFD